MSILANRTKVVVITILVAAIVIGAVTLSSAAMMENLRFARSTSQTYWLVNAVRGIVIQQKSFAQSPGEDLWVDLTGVGQVTSTASHANPWGADIKAATIAGENGTMIRLENELPANACRRMAFYFLSQKAADLGLLGMAAQPKLDANWVNLYPTGPMGANRLVTTGCGDSIPRLAVVFKIR